MISREQISSVVKLLQASRRPIFIWGAGMRQVAVQALGLARSLGIPVACTWGAIDLMHHNDPLMAGGFGTHGTRAANFAIANSDLVISLGTRLDTKATGNAAGFVRHGRIVMCDIDRFEIEKFKQLGRPIDVPICADVREFIDALEDERMVYALPQRTEAWMTWRTKIRTWRKDYDTPKVTWPGVNPYELMKEIGKYTTKEDIICSDTGTALGYLMQAFPFKGERFLHAFNMTPMGYGLPAAIGATFATRKRCILVTGDGSFLMSAAELATVARWSLNIKIILLNNQGHSMCRQTERQWFCGKHCSTDVESGLGFPDWESTAIAFGLETWTRDSNGLRNLMHGPEAGFIDFNIHPDAYLIPQARFGQPIEDQDPQLPRDEFKEQMRWSAS